MALNALVVVLLSLFSVNASAGPNATKPLALVWSGGGVCAEDCASAAAEQMRIAGFRVRYVNGTNFSSRLLAEATVWVQPGGDAIQAAQALGADRRYQIKEFVRKGGRYMGYCAGAFLADKWLDDAETVPGLGITPVVTLDYRKDVLGSNSVMLDVVWGSQTRQIYFSEGATFGGGSLPVDGLTVFAEYVDARSGYSPAGWENRFGAGRVVVAGMHPEAPEPWKDGLEDRDGSDYDLAQDMIRRLMAPL